MYIYNGDELTMILSTPQSHEWVVNGEASYTFADGITKVYVLTPLAKKRLARGYVINWFDKRLHGAIRRLGWMKQMSK